MSEELLRTRCDSSVIGGCVEARQGHGFITEQTRLPCCNTTWAWLDEIMVEVHCPGVMELDTDTGAEYVCDICFARCGSWAHSWEMSVG